MAAGDEAPNFQDEGYPGKAERLGPAWRACWAELEDGRWHVGQSLYGIAENLKDSSVRSLLDAAVKAQVIGKKSIQHNSGLFSRRVYYRRIDVPFNRTKKTEDENE